MKNRRISRTTAAAVLAAAALVTFVIESRIPPPVALPGVKLGLANVFTLLALHLLGRRAAAAVLVVRITLGALFTGTALTLLYSLAGGVCCYLVMAAVFRPLGQKLLWVTSVLGALAHNAGQLAVAGAILGRSVFFYAPVLAAAGIVTGVFTGLAAGFSLKALQKAVSNRRT